MIRNNRRPETDKGGSLDQGQGQKRKNKWKRQRIRKLADRERPGAQLFAPQKMKL